MSVYYVGDMPVSDELYHHGIKGQHWGIRRYQNPDGSLTAAGKARYGTAENFNRAQEMKKAKSQSYTANMKSLARSTGVAFNLTKKQREKTAQIKNAAKESDARFEKARAKYEKSSGTKKVKAAKEAGIKQRKEIHSYGKYIAKNMLSAAAHGGMAYVNIKLANNPKVPIGLRYANAILGGANAADAISSFARAGMGSFAYENSKRK